LPSAVASKGTLDIKNCVDIESNTPQYLGVKTSFLLSDGVFESSDPVRALQGKIVHGGDFMATKKKAAKKKKKH
jgi:hypothetical protein